MVYIKLLTDRISVYDSETNLIKGSLSPKNSFVSYDWVNERINIDNGEHAFIFSEISAIYDEDDNVLPITTFSQFVSSISSDIITSSGIGASSGSNLTSKFYKYTAQTYNDLINTVTDAEEGDIARIFEGSGIWPNRKSEGGYTYTNGSWKYGSRTLQSEIQQNDADIATEISARISGDNVLQSNINAEETARTNADVVLQSQIDDIYLKSGWWNITDTTFTSTSPQSILANTRSKLIINSDSVINGFGAENKNSSEIWSETDSKITPLKLGDSYIFRIALTANPTLNNRNFTVDLDIGGTQGVVFERSTRLARGANTNTKISMTNSIFTLGTFLANGGEIYITCDGDVEIFNISIFIQKVTENE